MYDGPTYLRRRSDSRSMHPLSFGARPPGLLAANLWMLLYCHWRRSATLRNREYGQRPLFHCVCVCVCFLNNFEAIEIRGDSMSMLIMLVRPDNCRWKSSFDEDSTHTRGKKKDASLKMCEVMAQHMFDTLWCWMLLLTVNWWVLPIPCVSAILPFSRSSSLSTYTFSEYLCFGFRMWIHFPFFIRIEKIRSKYCSRTGTIATSIWCRRSQIPFVCLLPLCVRIAFTATVFEYSIHV